MEGRSPREIDTWSLDEIYKFNAVLDWQSDVKKAVGELQEKELEDLKEKLKGKGTE